MKIAVSSKGQGLDAQLDPRFGRADFFLILDVDSSKILKVIDNTASQDAAHGAGINAATVVAEAGAEMVLTGHVGPKAMAVLDAAGIKVIPDASGTVREAVERFVSGGFKEACGLEPEAHHSVISGQGTARGAGRQGGGGRGRCGCRGR